MIRSKIADTLIIVTAVVTGRRSACHSAESLFGMFINIIAWGRAKVTAVGVKTLNHCCNMFNDR